MSFIFLSLMYFPQAVPHRWNSFYDMLKRLCEQQLAISAALFNHRDIVHLEHTPDEWRLMEDFCEVLEPFKDVTNYLSADKYPILAALGPLFVVIKKKLESDPNSCPSAVSHTVKQVVFSDMEMQYSDPDVRMSMNKAALLDPRFKSLTYFPEEEQQATINSIVNEIVTGYVTQSTINCTSAASENEIIDEEPGEPTDPSPKKKCCLEKILEINFQL